MTRRRGCFTACLVALLALVGTPLTAGEAEDAAQAAAGAWLPLVDSGNYSAAWNQAAAALKRAVKQAEWSEQAEAVRGPLGAIESRRVKSREYTEKAPATRTIGGRLYTVGQGKYVVIQYESAFARKATAAESVIVTADSDGAWRVAGYSLR